MSSMLHFGSKRERRLWLATLALVAAIFSTLGLAQQLVSVIPESNVVSALFVVGLILVLASIGTQGIRQKRSGVEIGILLGAAAVYLLVFVRMAIPAERTHLIEYGVVAAFIYQAFLERLANGRHVPAPALLAILLASLIGALDEVLQAALPTRFFDLSDMLFNTLAAVMSVSASSMLGWARRRFGKRDEVTKAGP